MRVARCRDCNKRVWPWQESGGYGPIGFRNSDPGAAVWHTSCLLKGHVERHATTGCTSVCRLLGCPSDS